MNRNLYAPRKRFVARAGIAAALGAFGTPLCAAEQSLLRMSFLVTAKDPSGIECLKFARLAEQKSKLGLRIDAFFNGTLSTAQNTVVGMQNGVVDLALIASPWLEPTFARMQAVSLPFIFPSRTAQWRALDGEIGGGLATDMLQKGVQVLAWGGFTAREFELRERRVTKPEDLRGMRIRIIDSPLFASMMQALGAVPVVINGNETPMALQQKVIDGLDYPVDIFLEFDMDKSAKYLSMTDHVLATALLIVSKKRFDALPGDQQRALVDAAREFLPGWRRVVDQAGAAAVQEFVKRGGTVDQVDKPAFRRAVAPVYDDYRKKLGADYIDRVIKLTSS